jgi:curved DNA-binding protein CbpA
VTYYELLGVAPDASTDEIRRAYVELARRHHPDVGGAEMTARMQELNQAWHVLGDRGRRLLYDAGLTSERPRPVVPPDDGWEGWDEWRAEEESDEPIGPTATTRWRAMLPVALFAAAVGTFCIGVVMAAAPLLALAIVLLIGAGAAFVIVPFLEMAQSRRRDGAR